MATAIPAGFPTAETTGVPSGTNLTAYTGPMTISTNGTVIEGKIISGTLRVTADNVIIKNCLVTYDGWWGVDAEGAANITIQDCTFVGPGAKAPTQAAILGSGTFLRNDISKVENGITLTEGPSIVIGNYIHDLEAGGADPHYDGIELHGRQNGVLIENNTVIGRDTSDIFIKNNYGPISNVIVNNNFLAGNPGYNIYVDARASGGPITGVSITNNYMLKGNYGYISIDKATPTVSGNIVSVDGSWPTSSNPTPTDPTPTNPTPVDPTPTQPTPADPTGTDPGQISDTPSVNFTGFWQTKFGVTKIDGKADPGNVVKFYDGATYLGLTTVKADGSWTFSKSGLSTKSAHTIKAQEVDSSGQVIAESSGAVLIGSNRSDTLTGTKGNDFLVGKYGQDTFVFHASFGKDVIMDFAPVGRGHDVLCFDKSVFDSFVSVLDHASQIGRDVVISTGSDTLTLKNTKLGDLKTYDFQFV